MGRWTQYDEDSYRLPSGMTRTGYDADTGQYYFTDRSGATYAGQPGSHYGPMHAVSSPPPLPIDNMPSTPEKKKRRVTLSSVPSTALRSLRRSLTTVRSPWRRSSDQSESDDDDEPVLVSRPSSVASDALRTLQTPSKPSDAKPAESGLSEASAGQTDTVRSKTSRPPPPKRVKVPSIDAYPEPSKTTTDTTTPPPPPPKSKPAHVKASSVDASTLRFATTGRSRRAASENPHSSRPFGRSHARPATPLAATPKSTHHTPIFDAMHTLPLTTAPPDRGVGATPGPPAVEDRDAGTSGRASDVPAAAASSKGPRHASAYAPSSTGSISAQVARAQSVSTARSRRRLSEDSPFFKAKS